jgi:hypothetical protein
MSDMDKTLSNDNDTSNDEKIEIKMPHSDIEKKVDDEYSNLFERIKDMIKDQSRMYNGRRNSLIFRSEDTDLKLFHKLCNVTTPIIAFVLNSEKKFEFLYLDKESIKSVYDDFSTITLTDEDDDIHLKLYVDIIFPRAIKSGEDYLVECIIDKCITHYNNNYDKSFAPKILSIITTSFSILHDAYPNYIKKFISTLTIYNKNDENDLIMSSSDGHLQSYPKSIKNFPFLFRPYIFTIIIYSMTFIVKSEGYSSPLIILGLTFFYFFLSSDIQWLILRLLKKLDIFDIFHIQFKKNKLKKLSVKLFIPFPKFATYCKDYNFSKELWNPDLNEFIKNHYDSTHSDKQPYDLYSDWNGEALIKFKWECFGKFYYHCIWHIYNVFFLFSILMIYPNLPKSLVISIINIILGFFLFLLEVRKFFFDPAKYFSIGSNFLSKYN